MFSPHGAMSVMRHWEFTLVLDNSGASVGMSLGQSGTENKMQNNHLSYTIQRTLGGRFRLWLNQFFMNCILPPLKDSVFRTHQHWNIYFELKRGHSNFLSVSGIYSMGGAPVMSKLHIMRSWRKLAHFLLLFHQLSYGKTVTQSWPWIPGRKKSKAERYFLRKYLFYCQARMPPLFVASWLSWLKNKQKKSGG